ncbi:hypothetical protein [Rhizorhabdus wittichii]|uniref:hypothetical protein n=1 Tax=Rhizorhabdus wittichii TaxID=160791 RepID=UPI00035E9BD1|nr:hypothetical protein [Rhizorhabdus wittichii]
MTRLAIPSGMAGAFDIDVEKLRADMAAHVERVSARKFSLAATGGTNPDFYRNFANNGQDKRLSAKVFMGIVKALGRDPYEYVLGVDTDNRPGDYIARAETPPQLQIPNEEDLATILRVLAPYVSEALGHEDDFPALARFLHTVAKWRLERPDAPIGELEAIVADLVLQQDDRSRPLK